MDVYKTFAISILLFGIVGYALSATCPPSDQISPCLCSEDDEEVDLALSCDSLTLEELQNILHSIDKSASLSLDLDEVDIGTLPTNFFAGVNLKRLEFSHCNLDKLAEEGGKALSGLEDTLEDLSILSSFTEENEPVRLDLSHLRRLSHLDLSYNVITELGDDWFERGPASLTHLTLSNNGIEKLGSRAFANLVNIQELWLDGNRFGPISRSVFPNPANHLDDLQLDNNALTSIPDDLFSGMPVLREVALRNNGITRLPQSTWQGIWEQMEVIDLRGNPLDCDSEIDWILSANTLAVVAGTCETPQERRGIDLEDLTLRV